MSVIDGGTALAPEGSEGALHDTISVASGATNGRTDPGLKPKTYRSRHVKRDLDCFDLVSSSRRDNLDPYGLRIRRLFPPQRRAGIGSLMARQLA